MNKPYFKITVQYYDVESDKYSGNTVYEQSIDNLDLQAVIKAANLHFDQVEATKQGADNEKNDN